MLLERERTKPSALLLELTLRRFLGDRFFIRERTKPSALLLELTLRRFLGDRFYKETHKNRSPLEALSLTPPLPWGDGLYSVVEEAFFFCSGSPTTSALGP